MLFFFNWRISEHFRILGVAYMRQIVFVRLGGCRFLIYAFFAEIHTIVFFSFPLSLSLSLSFPLSFPLPFSLILSLLFSFPVLFSWLYFRCFGPLMIVIYSILLRILFTLRFLSISLLLILILQLLDFLLLLLLLLNSSSL